MADQRIFLAGDSTVACNFIETYPQAGWGQAIYLYLPEGTVIRNFAVNGRSTRSFIAEGRLAAIDAELQPGDILIIQFGHNDQKDDPLRRTEAFGSYQDFLGQYVETARARQARPVLVSPLYRRYFDDAGLLMQDVHFDYPRAMQELAIRLNVPFIDLCGLSQAWLQTLGDEATKKLFMHLAPGEFPQWPQGLADNTHLRHPGAVAVAGMVARGLAALGLLPVRLTSTPPATPRPGAGQPT